MFGDTTLTLTPLQSRFVEAYLASGGDAGLAAQAAGSKAAEPSSVGSQMLRKPHVRQAIRDKALEVLDLKLVAKSVSRLDSLIDSEDERVALLAVRDALDRASFRAKDTVADVSFKGIINIDFTSPAEREQIKQADGTQGDKSPISDPGGKKAVPLTTTPPSHTIEGDYEDISD